MADEISHLEARGSYRPRSRELTARLDLTELRPAILAPMHPRLASLAGFELPVSGWIEGRLKGSRLDRIAFELMAPSRGRLNGRLDAVRRDPVDRDPVDRDPVDRDPVDRDPVDRDPVEVLLSPDVCLSGFSAHASFDGSAWPEIAVDARLAPQAPFTLRLGSGADGGDQFHFAASDVGQLARILRGPNQIEGGTVEVTAVRPSSGEGFAGGFKVEDFAVLELPLLTRILELGSLGGLLRTFSDSGLHFEKIEGEFTLDRRRLELVETRVYGRGFGMTAKGTLDFADGTLAIEGSVAPARTVQRVVGRIPLISQIVLGRQKEGVVATMFTVSGSFEDPEIKARALSTLTPGITREIFKLAPGRKK